ncbi:FAD-binding protein [bacterium]|nr:FAD-binding protein [bacterium]
MNSAGTSAEAASIQDRFSAIWLQDASFPAIVPRSADDVVDAIHWCRESGWRLLIVGRGSSFPDQLNVPEKILTILTLARTGVSECDPLDMVVETEPGVPSVELLEHVQDAGFRLAGWPEQYPGTVGGLIAGRNGPKVRHLLLGLETISGRGHRHRFGGRVRKDVSGFSLAPLFIGSNGRFGWIERVFLRLSPLGAPDIGFRPPKPSASGRIMKQSPASGVLQALDPDSVFVSLDSGD